MAYFQPDQLAKLRQGYIALNPSYERLLTEYLSVRLTNELAYEYVRHGFVRRLGTLKRCIENVYSTYWPERSDKPSRNESLDLAINLQAFILNVFGSIDNLAWIWVKEKNIKDRGRTLRDQQVGLRSTCTVMRNSFSAEFQEYLASRDEWFRYLENYRHALAHRVPLYVAPYTLNPAKLDQHNELEARKHEAHKQRGFELWRKLDSEQESLGTFTPWMMHSFSEGATPMVFHVQILADWNTVLEIAEKFLKEIVP